MFAKIILSVLTAGMLSGWLFYLTVRMHDIDRWRKHVQTEGIETVIDQESMAEAMISVFNSGTVTIGGAPVTMESAAIETIETLENVPASTDR